MNRWIRKPVIKAYREYAELPAAQSPKRSPHVRHKDSDEN